MYIQYCTSKQNGKTYTYPLLCHKYREDGKIKTKVILNLSAFSPETVLAIAISLKKDKEILVSSKEIRVISSIDYGYVFTLIEIMKELKIPETLSKTVGEDANLVKLLIIGKIVTKGSKLCIFNWIKRNAAIANMLQIDLETLKLEALYEALENVSLLQNKLERKWNLYHKTKNDDAIYLYDITSSYFEGTQNELASYGYNRDGKTGKKQIVIGLITNSEGFPLSVEVFNGNQNDHTTVISQLQKIRTDFNASNIIFVGDRGMRIRYNLSHMTQEDANGVSYITGLSAPEIRCLINEEIIQLSLFGKELAEIETEDERYVLCNNPDLAISKKTTRDRLKAKVYEQLEDIKCAYQTRKLKNETNTIKIESSSKKLNLVSAFSQTQLDSFKYRSRKCLEKYQMQSFFEITIDAEAFQIRFNEENYSHAEQLDGKYVFVTNISKEKMDKHAIRASYKKLQEVEHAFRDMKTAKLNVRPIYHRKEETTKGHICITMLSYAIIQHLEKKIHPWLISYNQTNKSQLSFNDITEELKMIKLNTLRIGSNNEVIQVTELTKIQKEIFSILKLKNEQISL